MRFIIPPPDTTSIWFLVFAPWENLAIIVEALLRSIIPPPELAIVSFILFPWSWSIGKEVVSFVLVEIPDTTTTWIFMFAPWANRQVLLDVFWMLLVNMNHLHAEGYRVIQMPRQIHGTFEPKMDHLFITAGEHGDREDPIIAASKLPQCALTSVGGVN